MNLYLRFFNDEVLVETVGQAVDFLNRLQDVKLNDNLVRDLTAYAESNNPYPHRFKVSARAYFIVIKTTAKTMEEFKQYAAEGAVATEGSPREAGPAEQPQANTFSAEKPGWYQAGIRFKRVMAVAGTTKFRYVDTDFEAKLKAHSVQDCYNRLLDHLRNRADIDPRSQFPSIKGRNFKFKFLGME